LKPKLNSGPESPVSNNAQINVGFKIVSKLSFGPKSIWYLRALFKENKGFIER